MSAVAALPPGNKPKAASRALRIARAVGNALWMLALGVGIGWGGIALTGYAGGILTSDDAAVLRHIAESDLSLWFGRPLSLEAARDHALFGFGFGLLLAYASLFGFAGAWFETLAAFRGDDAP